MNDNVPNTYLGLLVTKTKTGEFLKNLVLKILSIKFH
jgi:hypothetical protein